ncbi:MAG: RsmD family RNA methyltransferase, partial [Pseudomonadota bacterium]
MRIIGGQWRGLHLAEVGAGDPKAHLRPTSDRVREAIFNLLINGRPGDLVTGRMVLDLFAGTGALGLEALSRGAIAATLVENGRTAQSLIAQNIAKMRVQGQVTVLPRDATKLPAARTPFTLIFLDPPYGQAL